MPVVLQTSSDSATSSLLSRNPITRKEPMPKGHAISRNRSSRFKTVKRTIVRGGKRVQTHLRVLKASAKGKK